MSRTKWLAVVTAAYVGLSMAGGALLVDRALRRPKRPVTGADRARAEDLARTLGASLETVSVAAGDGVALRGWLFTPAPASSHSVLLLHGITANRSAMLSSVRLFVERGYRALAVDARAHGGSGGELSTFGALEADDLRRWIAWLRPESRDACVYAFGGSLGAAMAIQAGDAPGLCGVVGESAFASLREIVFDRIGQQLNTGPWVGRTLLRPGVELAFLYARIRYGLDLSGASAAQSAAAPGAPILLIHGIDDENAPVRHSELIHAANPARVSMWLVPGGTHSAARSAAPVEYPLRVMAFLAAHRSRLPSGNGPP